MSDEYIRKEDIKKLLEEIQKELTKGTDEHSITHGLIVSVIGIITCKIMQMGEKKDG